MKGAMEFQREILSSLIGCENISKKAPRKNEHRMEGYGNDMELQIDQMEECGVSGSWMGGLARL